MYKEKILNTETEVLPDLILHALDLIKTRSPLEEVLKYKKAFVLRENKQKKKANKSVGK